MNKYKRLSADEREEISRMLAQKCSFQTIAKHLNRYVSTISREVARDSCNKYAYRAAKAQNRAGRNASKRKNGKFRLDGNQELKRYIYKKLKLKWSPVQIAKELKKIILIIWKCAYRQRRFIPASTFCPEELLKKSLLLVCDRIGKEGINNPEVSKWSEK